MNYSISWENLTAPVSNAHFHIGDVGVSGGFDLGITDFESPAVGTGITLTDSQESNLLNGLWYVNLHTSNFGSGEIRGQVLVSPMTVIPEPSSVAALGGLLALFVTCWLRRRHRAGL